MPLNPRRQLLVSPGMRFLRGLAGKALPCGCLVGVYETYNGGIVATIDARGAQCRHPDHSLHEIVSLNASASPSEVGAPTGA
jgi:hypothetical protein